MYMYVEGCTAEWRPGPWPGSGHDGRGEARGGRGEARGGRRETDITASEHQSIRVTASQRHSVTTAQAPRDFLIVLYNFFFLLIKML